VAGTDTTAPTLVSLFVPGTIDPDPPFWAVSFPLIASDGDGVGIDFVEIVLDRTACDPLTGTRFTTIRLPSGALGSEGILPGNFYITGVGTYNILSVSVHDRQGNVSNYSDTDLAGLGINTSFTIAGGGSPDTVAPFLSTLDLPNVVDLSVASSANGLFRATGGDIGSAVDQIVIHLDRAYATPDSVRSDIVLNNSNGFFNSSVAFAQATANGTYNVLTVDVIDRQGNRTVYDAAQLAALGVETSFTVISPNATETTGPVLTGLTISSPDITNIAETAAPLVFNVSASDASGIDRVVIRFDNGVFGSAPNGNRYVEEITVRGGSGQINLLDATRRGLHEITSVEVYDRQGNVTTYTNSDLVALGFASGFTVIENAFDGTSGDDAVTGSNGVDSISGFAGNDTLDGLDGNDVMRGGGGNDILNGGGGVDRMTGGDGDDVLDGGTGGDFMTGGRGDDTYFIDDAGDRITELTGEGTDSLYTSISYILPTGSVVERLFLADGPNPLPLTLGGTSRAETLSGNGAANTLAGNGGGGALYGLGGDDLLIGGNGSDDILDGGTGADRMQGGTGADIYFVDNAGDEVVEVPWNGSPIPPSALIDTVYASIDYTLPGLVENLALTGMAFAGTGNELNNRIDGNSGNNVLSGLAGSDTLAGLAGNDVISGGDGDDGILGGDDNDRVDGDAGDDWLFGDAGSDTIRGGGGADHVYGGADDDGAFGGAGGDYIEGGAGADWLFGDAGSDTIRGDGGNDHIYGGDDADGVLGGAGDDYIEGGGGSDWLYAEDGNDILAGGAGIDYLTGGAGADQFLFNVPINADNLDAILDFAPDSDRILLDSAVFTGLASGALAAGAFVAGTAAADANDRIIYNAASGTLLFDPDGNGAAAATVFAYITPGTDLTAINFAVI